MTENDRSSVLTSLADTIKNCTFRDRFTEDEAKLLSDPYIISVFIDNADRDDYYFRYIVEGMFKVNGKSLIEPLKNSIDFSDKKATGMQVKYIRQFAGAEENDWYLWLTDNESTPFHVRENAILALDCSLENTERLKDLCKFDKLHKYAARTALSKLSPPEAWIIMEKLVDKYSRGKTGYRKYIIYSRNKVCGEFAVREFYKYLENGGDLDSYHDAFWIFQMLGNKLEAEECFAKTAELLPEGSYYLQEINSALMHNICSYPEPEYKNMLLRLYGSYPHKFWQARFELSLYEDPFKPDLSFIDNDENRRTYIKSMLLHKGLSFYPLLSEYRIFSVRRPTDFQTIFSKLLPILLRLKKISSRQEYSELKKHG